MYKSRLALRRDVVTVSYKDIDGALQRSGLGAMHQETEVEERAGPFNEMSTRIVDLFYFDKPHPTINEKHIITCNSVDYEVIQVRSLNELHGRLRVETVRVR